MTSASVAAFADEQRLKITVEGPRKQENGLPAVEHKKSSVESSKLIAASHSPSCSETSSLFSTVDCSSFSSRSDASSFVKEDSISATSAPSLCVSVRSSIELTSSSKLDTACSADSGSTVSETEYYEFSFRKGRIPENIAGSAGSSHEFNDGSTVGNSIPTTTQDDGYARYPVWTRYCSTDVHSCINPCFEKMGDHSEPRITRGKKLAKTLSNVLTKHLALSPGPTWRRTSCEKFSSRLGLDHPSASEKSTSTPARTLDPTSSAGGTARVKNSPLSKLNVYKVSPGRCSESRKSLGCLGSSKVPQGDAQNYEGPLYVATEESVHGGKNRCLPSPRLSFGSSRVFKQDPAEPSSSSSSMVLPSTRVHGQLHCIQRGDLPSFTFLVDGLEEVFVAKAVRPGSPSSLDTGDLLYTFYSWRPKGRAKGSWKSWMRKDKAPPDFVGRMSVNSRVVPASSKDGADFVELEFLVQDDNATCSPRLSFSTWDTSSTHTTGRSPSPAMYNGFPSPFCAMTPSPCRLASSRYVSVPSSSPPVRLRRSRRIPCSPLRPKSEDGRSSDAWSDTEAEAGKENHELAAIVIRLPCASDLTLASLNQKWERSRKSAASYLRKNSSSYYRRLSLPTRLETKENENLDTSSEVNRGGDSTSSSSTSSSSTSSSSSSSTCSRTRSLKLRELMGVAEDFGKRKKACDMSTVTAILPAGNHGIPLHGIPGPDPLIDRWRSGGRCDCGSWDLGCGLTIVTGEVLLFEDDESIEIISQSSKGEKQIVMSLSTVEDGFYSFSFEAPMTYVQAFASAVATLYTRGPAAAPKESCSRSSSSSRLPRFPLRPLASSAAAAADALSYCSPPQALDR